MQNQRDMVAKSIVVPDHGVYPKRVPKEEPKERERGEQWPTPEVSDIDHGEW